MQPEEVVDFCWVGQSQYRRMEREGYCTPALKNFHHLYREKIPRGNPSANIFDDKRKEERIFLSLFCAHLNVSLFDKNFPFRQPAIA